MPDENSSQTEQIAKSFEKVLNSHGYGFQYSILKQAETLAVNAKSFWIPSVPEFPIEVQGYGTRIDFILQNRLRPLYMLAECKRVNPALSSWCFARASYVPILNNAQTAFIETINLDESGKISTRINNLTYSENIYHIALETKSNVSGEPEGHGRGEIEQAATQICRGLNGMIDFFANHQSFFGKVQAIGFLPVIFTTADLWVSSVDLGSADLASGNINIPSASLKKIPWLFYHYNQSPGLKHALESSTPIQTLQDSLYYEYVRTIAVVSGSGITDFLRSGIFGY